MGFVDFLLILLLTSCSHPILFALSKGKYSAKTDRRYHIVPGIGGPRNVVSHAHAHGTVFDHARAPRAEINQIQRARVHTHTRARARSASLSVGRSLSLSLSLFRARTHTHRCGQSVYRYWGDVAFLLTIVSQYTVFIGVRATTTHIHARTRARVAPSLSRSL